MHVEVPHTPSPYANCGTGQVGAKHGTGSFQKLDRAGHQHTRKKATEPAVKSFMPSSEDSSRAEDTKLCCDAGTMKGD